MENTSVLVLAYLGDSIYEIYVREYLINKGIAKVKDLQEQAIKYVGAKGQAVYLKLLLENNILTESELDILYKARNHKCAHKPKNTDILTYKHATALEAVIGFLHYNKKSERIKEIMTFILKEDI